MKGAEYSYRAKYSGPLFLEGEGYERREGIAERDSLKDSEYSYMADPMAPVLGGGKFRVPFGRVEWEHVEHQADKENGAGAFEDFQARLLAQRVKFREGVGHGAACAEKEEGEDKVRGGASVPWAMSQDREAFGAVSRVVNNYHKTDSHASENIQR